MPRPQPDEFQDWTVVCAGSFGPTQMNTIIRRNLRTDDKQDRPIIEGQLPIIFSWGSGSIDSYHGPNRLAATVNFFDPIQKYFAPPDADGKTTLDFKSFKMTGITTQYICQTFDFGTTAKQVLAVLPKFTSGVGTQYLHHVLLHACGEDPDFVTVKMHNDKSMPCQSTDPK